MSRYAVLIPANRKDLLPEEDAYNLDYRLQLALCLQGKGSEHAMGAAMRFMVSAPVPVLHKIRNQPQQQRDTGHEHGVRYGASTFGVEQRMSLC